MKKEPTKDELLQGIAKLMDLFSRHRHFHEPGTELADARVMLRVIADRLRSAYL